MMPICRVGGNFWAGVELVITLGTGFGSALFMDGKLVLNLEMAHHQFRKGLRAAVGACCVG